VKSPFEREAVNKRKLEEWRAFAEMASKERDPAKLLELADQLCQELDKELLNPVPVEPSPAMTGT
jgi:hypothetical protein